MNTNRTKSPRKHRPCPAICYNSECMIGTISMALFLTLHLVFFLILMTPTIMSGTGSTSEAALISAGLAIVPAGIIMIVGAVLFYLWGSKW